DATSGDDSTVPPDLLAAFKPGSKLLATGEESESKGLLKVGTKDTVKFVALPILTSDSTGPYRGTLVFAAVNTPDSGGLNSSLTPLKPAFYGVADSPAPADVKQAIGKPTTPKTAYATPSSGTIVGYQTINDVYGHPVLVARVQKARDIHQTANSAL